MGKKKWVRRVLLFKCLLFLWEWEREFGDCCLQLKTGQRCSGCQFEQTVCGSLSWEIVWAVAQI